MKKKSHGRGGRSAVLVLVKDIIKSQQSAQCNAGLYKDRQASGGEHNIQKQSQNHTQTQCNKADVQIIGKNMDH